MKTFVLHVFCAAIVRRFETICVNLQLQNHNGSVAQLNRASDSGSEGRGFESHRNHQGGAVVSTAPILLQAFKLSSSKTWSRKSSEGRGFESHRNHQGVQLSQLHLFYQEGMASLPYPRSLSLSSLCCTFLYTHAALIHPFLLFVSTDADVRIDRRRCPYRPTQMPASTDADLRSDRRG